jgi:hypothetical protein
VHQKLRRLAECPDSVEGPGLEIWDAADERTARRRVVRRAAGCAELVARVTGCRTRQDARTGRRVDALRRERRAVALPGEELHDGRNREALDLFVEDERGDERIPDRLSRGADTCRNRAIGRVAARSAEGLRILLRGIVVGIRDVAGRASVIRGATSGLRAVRVNGWRITASAAAFLRERVIGVNRVDDRRQNGRSVRQRVVLNVTVRVREGELGRQTLARKVALIEFEFDAPRRLVTDVEAGDKIRRAI